MSKSIRIMLMFVCLLTACTAGNGASSAPAPLMAPGWEGVSLETICLEVAQSFPDVAPGFSLSVESPVRRLLQGLGMRVLGAGKNCDADLSLSLQGWGLVEHYDICIGDVCGDCYTGATISGKLTLAKPDRSPLDKTFAASIDPPSTIHECPRVPREAPFDEVMPRAVLSGLFDLWGAPVLEVALGDRDENVRMAAVRKLEDQGEYAVPLFIQALGDRSADVRQRAAYALGMLGEKASQAAPALIELVGDSNRPVRIAASSALHLITGKDYGQDQASWKKWLEQPEYQPTPVSSWKGIPVAPGIRSYEELGSMLQYQAGSSCEDVAAFYKTEMPAAGWTFIEDSSQGSYRRQLNYAKDRETAEIILSSSPAVTGQTGCNLQIFWRR